MDSSGKFRSRKDTNLSNLADGQSSPVTEGNLPPNIGGIEPVEDGTVGDVGGNGSDPDEGGVIVIEEPPLGIDDLEILAGTVLTIDANINVKKLIIKGDLVCPLEGVGRKLSITARTIVITGRLICGSASNRFAGVLNIRLVAGDPTVGNMKPSMEERGLVVLPGGELHLYGKVKTPVWHKISETANIGDDQLKFNQPVNWSIGDEVAVASSNFNFNEAERASIVSISADRKVITIDKQLLYRHWGETKTYSRGSKTWILDERSIVSNLSRNIHIYPFQGDFNTSELGGHVMVMPGGQAYVDSVEFSKMGRKGEMARYPIHWHRVGDAPGQFIKNSSIHDSFQRCVTIHDTNKLLVTNNICFNHFGHGLFLESGSERENIIDGNVIMLSKKVAKSRSLLISDVAGVLRRFPAPASYWISNPDNTVINNVAAGSQGTGFWMAFEHGEKCNASQCTGVHVSKLDTLAFDNNIAHSCSVGMTWDGGPNGNAIGNPNNPADREIVSTHYSPTTKPIFNNLVAYKNRESGIYFRGDAAQYNNAILADNTWSLFLAYSQQFKDTAIIGKSTNFSITDKVFYKESAGVTVYDGPFELEDVHFFDFPNKIENIDGRTFDNTPFLVIGGSNRFVNKVKGLTFLPEPRTRLKFIDPNINWFDSLYSSSIRDIDGSLGGVSNSLLVPNVHFNDHTSCIDKATWGAKICLYNVGLFHFSNADNRNNINFKVTAPSGATTVDELTEINGKHHNKFNVIIGETGVYNLSGDHKFLGSDGRITIRFQSEQKYTISPILRLNNLVCSVAGVAPLSSFGALRSSPTAAYFKSTTGTYLKLRADTENSRDIQSAYSQNYIQGVSFQCN